MHPKPRCCTLNAACYVPDPTMASHLRRGSTDPGGNQFTFAASPDRRPGGQDGAHGVEYGAWAKRITGGHGYFGKSDDIKLGAWRRGAWPVGGYESSKEDFRWLAREGEENDGFGAPSPPLWKYTGSPTTEARGRYVHTETGPTTRAREIARYRQEMLDLVKDLPESGYELSLRDMVVQPATPPRTRPRTPPRMPKLEEDMLVNGKWSSAKAASKDRKRTEKGMTQLSRSESTETGGFLLKMFTPVAIGDGRRKSTSGGGHSRAKISPRPSFEAEKGCSEGSDGEWWKKNKLSGSEGSSSSSGTTSSSSSSNNTNTSNVSSSKISGSSRKMNGCYPFLLRNKK